MARQSAFLNLSTPYDLDALLGLRFHPINTAEEAQRPLQENPQMAALALSAPGTLSCLQTQRASLKFHSFISILSPGTKTTLTPLLGSACGCCVFQSLLYTRPKYP